MIIERSAWKVGSKFLTSEKLILRLDLSFGVSFSLGAKTKLQSYSKNVYLHGSANIMEVGQNKFDFKKPKICLPIPILYRSLY